jgi:hypothetical protein
MAILVEAGVSAAGVREGVGVRVGMLLGRYLDDVALVRAVADDVAAGWLGSRDRSGEESTLEQWWDGYVALVESAVGGVDCATDDDLRRVWITHARRLNVVGGPR